MAVYLVLVRHGQAEDLVTTDAERHLTEAGIRALRASLPTAFSLLPNGCDLRLWSSPLARAQETAIMVCGALGYLSIELKDHLAIGDAGMFDFELSAVAGSHLRAGENAGDLAIIAVGHEPMISELAERCCGSSLAFGKGAACCIRLNTEGTSLANRATKPGRLMWFVQGAEAKRWQVLVDLENILAGQYAEVRERLAEFKCNPSDAEAVHQLRVSIRTLRSLVKFVEPLQDRKQNRAMQRNLRDIVRQLSRLRELDVLGETLRDAEGEDAVVDEDGQSLGSVVARMRVSECLRVLEALEGKRDRRAFARLDEEFASIRWKGAVEREGLAKTDVQARFRDVSGAYQQHMAALDVADWEQTHSVRKEAKQVRYDAAKFKRLLGSETAGVVSEMKAVQEHLGDICDARVNQEMLAALAHESGLSEALSSHAWAMAQAEAARERELLEISGDSEA